MKPAPSNTNATSVTPEPGSAESRHLPRNTAVIVGAYFLTRLGDALISPKVTLVWLLASLGAPVWMTGLLVPIRESGSLLPQLVVAGYIRALAVRKWVWVVGSVLQAMAVAGIGGIALTAAAGLPGSTAGLGVLGCLVVFSLARGLCSVAAKDVLGKTIPKRQRGWVNGLSTSAAGIGTLVAAGLVWAPAPADDMLLALVFVAAGLWLLGAAVYVLIDEPAGEVDTAGVGLRRGLSRLVLLVEEANFRRFVLARALLLSTALAAPFYVLLSRQHADASLGYFLFAQGSAALLGGPLWGRFADRSSRLVMAWSAGAAAVLGGCVLAAEQWAAPMAASPWFYPLLFFLLMLIHDGVRLGRKTYVVDIASGNRRTDYVAVSNSVIGVLLLFAGLLGALAQGISPAGLIGVLALLAAGAAILCARLPEA